MDDETRDRLVHDLKNQLGIVIGFADWLLSEAPADDPRREDLAEIERAARRAVEIAAALTPADPEGPR